MSEYTDYMQDMFFSRVINVRETISSNKDWIRDYLEKRDKYPNWVTRDGVSIAVSDVTDSHLENLLNFLPANTPWHKVFSCEKHYRQLCKQTQVLEEEDEYNTKVMDIVF